MKYRKKPVEVEAVQWFKPGDHPAVSTFIYEDYGPRYGIQALEGTMWVNPGDWIVGPGVSGKYWPVQDDIFKQTYEPVESVESDHTITIDLDKTWTDTKFSQEQVNRMLMWW